MNKNSFRKILVVALDNLGDAVMATSVVRPLRAAFPGVQIGLWTKSYSAGLFSASSEVDTLHASDPFWDTAPGRSRGSFAEFRAALAEIKRIGYDGALILNTEWRRSLAIWLTGITWRVGFDQRRSRFFLTRAVKKADPLQHVTEEHRQLVERGLGAAVDPSLYSPFLEAHGASFTDAEAWRKKAGWAGNPLIALHPFAGHPRRWWPMAKWKELMLSLLEQDPRIRFLFIAAPAEKSLLEPLKDGAIAASWKLFEGPLSTLKGLLKQSDLFVGGDSGPGHVAAALGVPVLSLFGPSSPERFAPRGSAALRVMKRDPLSELETREILGAISQMGILDKIKRI